MNKIDKRAKPFYVGVAKEYRRKMKSKEESEGYLWHSTIGVFEYNKAFYLAKNEEAAKKKFKEEFVFEGDKPKLVVEEIEIKPGLNSFRSNILDDNVITLLIVTPKENYVFSWNDNAHIDYPEDLSWDRDLSFLFRTGISIGSQLVKDEHLAKLHEISEDLNSIVDNQESWGIEYTREHTFQIQSKVHEIIDALEDNQDE